MKLIYSLLLLFIISNNSIAQDLYTKDNENLGPKSDFMKGCQNSAQETMINLDGVEVDIENYCSCMADELIPKVYSWDIQYHMDKGDLVEWLVTGENLDILKGCLVPNVEMHDDYKFEKGEHTDIQMKVMVDECVNEFNKDPELVGVLTEEQARSYCECAAIGLYERGITYGELKEMENMDNLDEAFFNEVIIPCMTAAMEETDTLDYIPSGELVYEEVELIKMPTGNYKVKLVIDGNERYFLLDTGASDLVISGKLEQELLDQGKITADSYIGKETYTLADNSTVMCDVVILNNVQIGGFTVNNVEAAIMKDGGMLLGTSFLNMFLSWEIDKDSNKLMLVDEVFED